MASFIGSTIVSALSQNITNGLSVLGTNATSNFLPLFAGAAVTTPFNATSFNAAVNVQSNAATAYPWGSATVSNTDQYTYVPPNGIVRSYDFTISRGLISPDGINRSVILVNGKFPGPTISANWGDTFEITVHNQITGPEEGTALHWHGLLQKQTPYEDGVPGVQQCPIAPGSTFKYSFLADLYGSSWYHSHYSAQYNAGIFGAMIVYGPWSQSYDIDLGPIMLSDWYHKDYFSLVQQSVTNITGPPPASDNNLINGKMDFPCDQVPAGTCTPNAGLSKFFFQTGRWHRLRLINVGSEATQKFSIDGYNMVVIANDFVPIHPYTTNVVTLGIGQRSDVLVYGKGKATDAVWMRSDISACSLGGVVKEALAPIYYPKANQTTRPTTVKNTFPDDPNTCGNDDLSLTVPFQPQTPPATPATVQQVDITLQPNKTGFNLWNMNNQTFRANYNIPILQQVNKGNFTFDKEWNVYNFGANSSIRIVLNNFFPAAHPMHLHGHNFWILSEGQGRWDGTTIVRPDNPQRRDVQLLQKGSLTNPSHLVIEFNSDNPGVWPLHCHIAWHVSAGLYITVIERPADIMEANIPAVLAQTCTDWDAYSNREVVDQIDSGLRMAME